MIFGVTLWKHHMMAASAYMFYVTIDMEYKD